MKTAKTPKNALTRKVLAALQSAVAKVVAQHRRDGRPLAVWRNGKAVLVSSVKKNKHWAEKSLKASKRYRVRPAIKKS